MLLEDLKPGAVLAERYRLERSLGRGGMGMVYLATQLRLERPVAVKVLDFSVDDSPQAFERFKREGQAAASIRHPNVVEVLDTGTTPGGLPYLVMEYLEGPTLKAFVRHFRVVEPGVVAAIAEPILEALEAAHVAGIVHRDLKPANVILATGTKGQVKLLDFGISKFLRGVTVITRTGVALGTPQYMSPEQIEGKRELTPASDLYSLGVMLFEMLAGRSPFLDRHEPALMRAVVMEDAPPLLSVAPAAPPPLCQLVDRLLSRDLAARPQSAREVRRELEGIEGPAPTRLWYLVAELGRAPSSPGPVREELATPEHDLGRPTEPELAPGDTVEYPRPAPSGRSAPVALAVAGGFLVALGAVLAWALARPTRLEAQPRVQSRAAERSAREERARMFEPMPQNPAAASRASPGGDSEAPRPLAKRLPSELSPPRAAMVEAPRTGSLETQELIDAAREANKKSAYAQAKVKLLTCIKLEPQNPDCHKLLGSTYALLKDNKRGVFHYKKFLELAPDDPSANKVKAIVGAYEASQH